MVKKPPPDTRTYAPLDNTAARHWLSKGWAVSHRKMAPPARLPSEASPGAALGVAQQGEGSGQGVLVAESAQLRQAAAAMGLGSGS